MAHRFGAAGRTVALTLTVGVTISLAGCGSSPLSGPGYASKDNTTRHSAPLSRDELMTASYQAAMKAGSAHMGMTMSGQAAVKAQGDVAYTRGGSAMQMTMSMPQLGQGKIAMRYVGQIMYLQIPRLTPPGKFLAIDPRDQGSPLAKSFAGLTGQMDPLDSVKSMGSAVISADRVGQGSFDGVPVDHYRVVVDAMKMMSKVNRTASAGMPKTVTYDLWLDNLHLIRKMTFDVSGTSVEIVLSKWGHAVKVRRPAAGDVLQAPGA